VTLLLLIIVALSGLVAMNTISTGTIPILGIVFRPSETHTTTPSPTLTPTASITPSSTATSTFTLTPTPTPTYTSTPTSTSTYTYTPSNTPSPTTTDTFTPSPTNTPTPSPTNTLTPTNTYTPTIDLTSTQIAAARDAQNRTATVVQLTLNAIFLTADASKTRTPDYTATALKCNQRYDLISPQRPDTGNPKVGTDSFVAGKFFEAKIVLRNTGDCDWLPGMYLQYKDGEQIGAPLRVDMDSTITAPIRPGETAQFIFKGRAPDRGRVYTGNWELRTKDGVLIPPLLPISLFIFQQ